MPMIEKIDYARLSCRIKSPVKQQAEAAAQLLGQSITDFTEAALSEKAQTVLEQQERLALSERDFVRFVEAIENTKPPTPQLAAAMRDFEERVRAGQIIDNT